MLIIQTYLVDAEVPFWCGKRTLESWDFNIDGRGKVLEIGSKIDGLRIKLKMIDTQGGHYGIVLETRKKNNVLYMEDVLGDDMGVLFLWTRKMNSSHSRP